MNDQPGEPPARGVLDAERDMIANLHADLQVLARHLTGGAERNPFVAVRASHWWSLGNGGGPGTNGLPLLRE
jgi:hypothetical protein